MNDNVYRVSTES